jgi:hypothetical protein
MPVKKPKTKNQKKKKKKKKSIFYTLIIIVPGVTMELRGGGNVI